LELVKAESPGNIYEHVLRKFVSGAFAAKAESLKFNEEFFFLGAILHDLGLTERFGASMARLGVSWNPDR